MPTTMSFAKAEIINLDNNDERVECMFKPKEYSVAKTNSWSAGQTKGSNVPPLEFSSGSATTLTMQLFFDTYESKKDVRKEYTSAIWKLMSVDTNLQDPVTKRSRPPRVRFQWGSAWSFNAVITSITQKF